ncbi:hypothetical protein [Aquipluma nitroreducens]|uniref:hypothetical protein n=1 Tax=Aquipluma nitroreducens TaxID=2010828 RepID=UPI00296EE030|nr:hypothetical protein [Aquipluma nitroreducens]
MEQYHQNLIEILKRYLSDNDITIVSENEGYFELFHFSKPDVVITAQYLLSLPVHKYFHGSSNNTEIDTIARFEVPDVEEKSPPNFYIFPIHNPKRGKLNFAVVPSQIVIERTRTRHQNDLIKRPLEVTFWLMPDDCLYDCTNISAEGEWFFLSKGANGRMADDIDWNYTPFLNNWQLLVNI